VLYHLLWQQVLLTDLDEALLGGGSVVNVNPAGRSR
jgi:hypothetical protein